MHNKKAIDLGTGAGFPGLPIALVFPELSLTLVDSIQKKCRFLETILLPSVAGRQESIPAYQQQENTISVLCARAETLSHQNEYREKYDFAFARALAKPLVALKLLLPFVKIGGMAFFWTSGKDWAQPEKIEKQAQLLGAQLYRQEEYLLPDEQRKRAILSLKKISQTDPKFPNKTKQWLRNSTI